MTATEKMECEVLPFLKEYEEETMKHKHRMPSLYVLAQVCHWRDEIWSRLKQTEGEIWVSLIQSSEETEDIEKLAQESSWVHEGSA